MSKQSAPPGSEKRTTQRFALESHGAFSCQFTFNDGSQHPGELLNLCYDGFSSRFPASAPALQLGAIVTATIFYYKLPFYAGEVRAVHCQGDVIGFECIMSYHYLSASHFDAFIAKLFEEERRELDQQQISQP